MFAGDQLLCAYLRPSNIDGSRHARAILWLIARRLRQAWPDVRVVCRGDGGFCRHRLMRPCDRRGIQSKSRARRCSAVSGPRENPAYCGVPPCAAPREVVLAAFLSSMAYVLLETLRRAALAGTELANAQAGTIRLTLLKIAAVVRLGVRRVVLHLSESFPLRELFAAVVVRLSG